MLANLSDTSLTGLCLFFVRTKVDAVINPKNIHEVRIILPKYYSSSFSKALGDISIDNCYNIQVFEVMYVFTLVGNIL